MLKTEEGRKSEGVGWMLLHPGEFGEALGRECVCDLLCCGDCSVDWKCSWVKGHVVFDSGHLLIIGGLIRGNPACKNIKCFFFHWTQK